MNFTLRGIIIAAVTMAIALSASATDGARAAEDMMENMSDKMDMDSGMDMSKKKDDMKMPSKMPMKMMAPTDAPTVPPVAGYSEGERKLFLHTEASDPKIAQLLTDMMGSPVVFVPSLSRAPADLLATGFAFASGVKPDGTIGPLEFQPDVFDFPPDHAGYRPLRRIVFVRWHDSAVPRILTSANDVARAAADGQVLLEETSIVVNMPMLTWPGGRR